MADLTITAASVVKVTNAIQANGVAGETITAGQSLYIDTSDSDKLKLTDADAVLTAVAAGISLCGAASGQPIVYLTSGGLDIGATLVVGEVYVASVTPGGVAPEVDLATGDFPTILGIATTASNINININVGGIAKD